MIRNIVMLVILFMFSTSLPVFAARQDSKNVSSHSKILKNVKVSPFKGSSKDLEGFLVDSKIVGRFSFQLSDSTDGAIPMATAYKKVLKNGTVVITFVLDHNQIIEPLFQQIIVNKNIYNYGYIPTSKDIFVPLDVGKINFSDIKTSIISDLPFSLDDSAKYKYELFGFRFKFQVFLAGKSFMVKRDFYFQKSILIPQKQGA